MKKLHLLNYTGLLLFFVLLFVSNSYSQQKDLTWNQLSEVYKFPQWYTEARFGIWVHWGAQAQPDSGGGWYARHMYMQNVGSETWGENAYPYHVRTYGHPSEAGFKEVINSWKAEKLNTDALVKYFKSIGAKYFVALANHHDHFDNFNSTYHPWNSVNVGPKKDIIGLFKQSAVKYGIPFGVSVHDDRYFGWWQTAFGADTSGPKKGVPYDGNLTKADGKGKWWDGLDPADLYGLPTAKHTPEWETKVKKNWVLRIEELVGKYDVDMLWFDGWGFPYNEYGKEACTWFFNKNYREHNGKFTAVIAGKFNSKEPAIVNDIERGGANEIKNFPWQGTTTFSSWFYKKDAHLKHNARTVIETLADINSKNGNLLLNVDLYGDGSIPDSIKHILDTLGIWINRNNEAIYTTHAWTIFGDNLKGKQHDKNITMVDIATLKKETEDFNERTVNSPAYPHNEVRFTVKGNSLFVFVLNPIKGEIEIPSLGLNSTQKVKNIKSIKLLGSKQNIKFTQLKDKLILDIPKEMDSYTQVFKIEGAL